VSKPASDYDAMLERLLKRAQHLEWTYVNTWGWTGGLKRPKMRIDAGLMATLIGSHIRMRREWQSLNEDNDRLRRRLQELGKL
jgi:hypothetical protein